MISPQCVRIMVKPVDMRLGIDRLTSLAQQTQSTSACDGLVYIFRNQSGSRIQAICWDGNGVWMSVRRLHNGKFHWPKWGDSTMQLSTEQFALLVIGLDWQKLHLSPPNWQV